MLTLTVESSCDETAAAVVEDGRRIRANAVASQIPVHRRYGGVVPELASRNHVCDIHPVVSEALEEAGLELSAIDGVGVTAGPGLIGSLLVGIETAKGLAFSLDVPCVGLDHIEGHLTTPLLDLDGCDRPDFPYVGLVVSGGHSHLYLARELGDYELLGKTRDDAAGEAFDKVAKMLGLPYPGGVEIDRLASEGDPQAVEFPRPMWTRSNLDFSFAGLKTAVYQHLQEHGVPEGEALSDLCASFQQAVVDVLVMKTAEAADRRGVARVVLSGGVAANSTLRREMRAAAAERGFELSVTPTELCTDNAAMLGPIAEHYLERADEGEARAPRIEAKSNAVIGA
ncbi:MAG: tRNA (adenosine(37)-N6)-threonylcarbamoyltransferase complex transferase subunit TsaD [Bradymonadaceae bacterium]